MLHIKLKGIEHRSPWKQICTHPRPLGWGQKVNFFPFLKVVMLHIKLKGIEHRSLLKANRLSLHTTSNPGVGSKGQIFFSILKVVMLHIKLK